MTLEHLLKNVGKLKMQPADLYFLALRQILLNQSELLLHNRGEGHAYQYANDSRMLAARIGEFIENKQ